MIKEFATYIVEESDYTIDDDLFVGHRPPTAPDRCAVILETIGGQQDQDLSNRAEYNIQIINRGATYFNARDDAFTLFDLLKHLNGIELPVVELGPTYYADVIRALAPPQSIGQDEKGLYEFSTNYVLKIGIVS